MDDIIRSIIDIDNSASKKLEDAEAEKLKIITGAKLMEEQIVKEAVESSENELKKLEKKLESDALEKIAALERERDEKISDMKRSFEVNSEKWRSEIISAVKDIL